jgi:apolipoprotein D and lipocalin family protein
MGILIVNKERDHMFNKSLLALLFIFLMSGCARTLPSLKTVDRVDLKRYMGPWYVIACIPTFIETKAYNV